MTRSLRLALKGFMVCSLVMLFFHGILYVFGSIYLINTNAEELIRTYGYDAIRARATIREESRFVILSSMSSFLIFFLIYWLLAGAIGLKRGLGPPIANGLLLSGTACLAFLTVNRFFYWIDGFCDQLPFPHEGFQITKVYECPSSSTFLYSVTLISYALFFLSLVFRAIHSHSNQR